MLHVKLPRNWVKGKFFLKYTYMKYKALVYSRPFKGISTTFPTGDFQ